MKTARNNHDVQTTLIWSKYFLYKKVITEAVCAIINLPRAFNIALTSKKRRSNVKRQSRTSFERPVLLVEKSKTSKPFDNPDPS